MEGKIVHFRRGVNTQQNYQMLVRVEGVDSRDNARKLIHKKVVWTSPGKQQKKINGEITNVHGNKGVLRVQFERGLPGQSIGSKVDIN